MKAKVIWYNGSSGNGEAETACGKTVLIYERAFKGEEPKSGDMIIVMKTKEFPGSGEYAQSAKVIKTKSMRSKVLKAA